MLGSFSALVSCGRPKIEREDMDDQPAGPDKLPKKGIDLRERLGALSPFKIAAMVTKPLKSRSSPKARIPLACTVSAENGSIGISCNPDDEEASAPGLKVEVVDPEGPSAGIILPGDRIVAVGNVDVDKSRVDSAMLALAGYIAANPSNIQLIITREFTPNRTRSNEDIVKTLNTQLISNQAKVSTPEPEAGESGADEFQTVDVSDDADGSDELGHDDSISPENLNVSVHNIGQCFETVDVGTKSSLLSPQKSTHL